MHVHDVEHGERRAGQRAVPGHVSRLKAMAAGSGSAAQVPSVSTTEVVHELYLRMCDERNLQFGHELEFFATPRARATCWSTSGGGSLEGRRRLLARIGFTGSGGRRGLDRAGPGARTDVALNALAPIRRAPRSSSFTTLPDCAAARSGITGLSPHRRPRLANARAFSTHVGELNYKPSFRGRATGRCCSASACSIKSGHLRRGEPRPRPNPSRERGSERSCLLLAPFKGGLRGRCF